MSTSIKTNVQSFGRTLSAMVMPNIGAFIAWGLVTALFIPTGWLPNENLASLVDPMLKGLLPLLIGYTGGKNVYGVRGGVMAAVVTTGVIVGSSIPMFLGAMIVGPLAGFVIKKFDELVDDIIPPGFEMLVNNFSLGILGTIMAVIAYLFIGPVVGSAINVVTVGVDYIVALGLLPLVSIIVEPAKVLFLNNALNHGVFGPLGAEQAATAGQSIFFLIETNPGPGLGILLAYWVFGKGTGKESAPGAIIIHFFGGIHEIYFPYVLMNPKLFLAVILGGMSGVFTFGILGAGLIATPAPGSIFAILAMCPPKDVGNYIAVLAGISVSTAVSFAVASIFVKKSADDMTDEDMEAALQKTKDMKNESKGTTNETSKTSNKKDNVTLENVNLIVYACDAGMGSSAMGASMVSKRLKQRGITIPVKNYAINEIPKNADIVVTHKELGERAKKAAPNAYHINITDFLDMSVVDQLVELLYNAGETKETTKETVSEIKGKDIKDMFTKNDILLELPSESKEDAIKRAGKLLVTNGYTKEGYIDGMLNRESVVSTYVGKGVAMPHGVSDVRDFIIKSGIVVLMYPDGVKFGDEVANMIVAIAGKDNEHLEIIAKLAQIIDGDIAPVNELSRANDKETIYKLFV